MDRLWTLAITAGAGAIAAVAGVFLVDRFRSLLKKKPKMKLFNNHLLLSTRCTWLIKELGAESDLEFVRGEWPNRGTSTGYKVHTTASLLGHKEPSLSCYANLEDCKLVLPGQQTMPEGDDITDYEAESMPALVVNDEFTMIEGAAICLYLADMYENLLPELEYKVEYYRWIVYTASTFDNIVGCLHQQLVETPLINQNPETLRHAFRAFHSFARALNDTLEDKEFICGDKFTAADCVVGFTLWWAYTIQQGTLLLAYPALLDYLDRLRSRQAFSDTFGDDESFDWNQLIPTYVRQSATTR